jgi:hypothetical protein
MRIRLYSMMKSHNPILLILSALLVFMISGAFTQENERIIDFHSDIVISRNASIVVQETITVMVTNQKIKHGIYRDLPTVYKDSSGNDYFVGFNPLSVQRDGRSEIYHSENLHNGVRVYMGSKDADIAPGKHTYVLTYRTDHQLGFFDDHDELYWNVTGNGWEFPLDKVSATVTLPNNIQKDQIKVEGYTGLQGSIERALTSMVNKNGQAEFKTTRPLGQKEGLTIVVSFPKKIVVSASHPPMQSCIEYITEKSGFFATGASLLLLLFYAFLWIRSGRFPRSGAFYCFLAITIITLIAIALPHFSIRHKYLGTWTSVAPPASVILESDGKGYFSGGFSEPAMIKWWIEGDQVKARPGNMNLGREVITLRLTKDRHLLLFEPNNANSPFLVLSRSH